MSCGPRGIEACALINLSVDRFVRREVKRRRFARILVYKGGEVYARRLAIKTTTDGNTGCDYCHKLAFNLALAGIGPAAGRSKPARNRQTRFKPLLWT